MKLREFNEATAVREAPIEKGKQSVEDVLSMMYGVIQRAEATLGFGQKDEGEKIAILKKMIADMLKDSEQKRLIRGGR